MSIAARVAQVVGFVLLVPIGFFYAASGLVVPERWVPGMWLVFGVLVVVAVRQRGRPWAVLGVAVAAVIAWVAILTFGDLVLGWTA